MTEANRSSNEVVFHNLELSKLVPEHVERVPFQWLKRRFWQYGDEWRRIRAKHRDPIDNCTWCGRAFADGEMMALAGPEKGENWIICETCADEMEGNPCPTT